MKKPIFKLLHLFVFMMVLLQACKKGELFESNTPKIAEISFAGSTSVPLEFFYDNAVIASTGEQNNSLPVSIKLNISKGDRKVYIREKGKSEILKTYSIDGTNFSNVLRIYYDKGEIYDVGIQYNLRIYTKDKLDLYLDDVLKYQSPFEEPIQDQITIPINKDQKRVLTVKKKGGKEVLLTKTITEADSNRFLKFYLEGNELLENLTIPALKNPKGMSVTFKLLTNVNTIETKFIGGDVDLLAYIRNLKTTDVKKTSPELRFTIPAKPSFVTMELPPISDSEYYTFDFVKKGTNEPSFTSNNLGKKVKLGIGNYGMFFFQNPDPAFFLPGERIICTIMPAEETGGANYDEIFVTPTINEYLTNWINFQ